MNLEELVVGMRVVVVATTFPRHVPVAAQLRGVCVGMAATVSHVIPAAHGAVLVFDARAEPDGPPVCPPTWLHRTMFEPCP